jgi:apoptosis-inducing factor 3
MSDAPSTTGPDLAAGIAAGDLGEGQMLTGHVGDENVLLARSGGEVFAINATCSHYGGPLGDGLLTDDAVRCPWHHACFSLRTGEALHAPALSPLACWSVEQHDGKIFVRDKKPEAPKKSLGAATSAAPGKIVIIGGGGGGCWGAGRMCL